MSEGVDDAVKHAQNDPPIEEFIPSRHFQPLDDDCAVDVVAAPENLSFPPGADGDVLVMEPVPSRIPRSVSFKDEVSEIANADEPADVFRATDDSALPTFATYSEKHDNGELARAAKEIALKMGRSLHVAATGQSVDGLSTDEGDVGLSCDERGAADEVPSSAAGMWAELLELRQRLNDLENAQRTMASSQSMGDPQRSASLEDVDLQDQSSTGSSPLFSSSVPATNPPLPPTSHPSAVPHIITDFGFGNMREEDRKGRPASSAPLAYLAPPETMSADKTSPSEAESTLMAYFTPLTTPSSTPRSTALNEGSHTNQLPQSSIAHSTTSISQPLTTSSQPNSPSRALNAAATKLASSPPPPSLEDNSSSAITASSSMKHGRSPPPSPKHKSPPRSPPSYGLAPSLLSLPEQLVLPNDLAHLGVSPTAQKTRKYSGNDSDDSGTCSAEDRRALVLSPRLAKGMDYSRKAWDDGAMVLRRANVMRSESIDHATSAAPEKGGSGPKKGDDPRKRPPEASSSSASGGEAPKKSHLPGPGLAVFDRAADPERVEDEVALQRRWVRSHAEVQSTRVIGFLDFLRTDLLAPSTPPVIEESIQRGVTNFLRVPLLFERFVAFGVFASLDMFLYVLTFLPLRTLFIVGRFTLACVATPGLALTWCFTPALKRVGWHLLVMVLGDPEVVRAKQRGEAAQVEGVGSVGVEAAMHENDADAPIDSLGSGSPQRKKEEEGEKRWVQGLGGFFGPTSPWRWLRPTFHRTHGYDLLRMSLFTGAMVGLQFLDMSRIYHHIRGQEMIKLYVIISMVEIFDRLLSSFGQDVLDSLYWTVRTRPRSMRLIYEVPIALVYIQLHACLFFVNVATINVAINSADQALMTLLVSNNFAEIKTSVFKKFDANNLFQVASSDATERFKLFVFMLLVLLLNLVQNAEKANQYLGNFWHQIRVVFGAEVVADWIKHAFISKFNDHDAGLYSRFTVVLVQDVTEARHDTSQPVLDHTHSLARRIGLAQVPLAAIAARFLQVVWGRAVPFFEISPGAQRELLVYAFACLLAAKVLTGILLAGICAEGRIAEETAKAARRKEREVVAARSRINSMSKWWS